jgi:hypothetical protein
MYTKKILSVVAATAVMSTGVMAFDSFAGKITNPNGSTSNLSIMDGNATILTLNANGKTFRGSSYTVVSPEEGQDLRLSNTFKGDALIYPAFNQRDGWGTEIIVRNTSDQAVVAKAVVYDGVDSHEAKDFNIYLSAHDVCRFTIEGGKIKSTDGSIKTYGAKPHFVRSTSEIRTSDRTDFALAAFANDPDHPFDEALTEETGYVIIYGMEQAAGDFHNNHAGLYAAYAASLDENRSATDSNARMTTKIDEITDISTPTGWRNVKNANVDSILNGMFVTGVEHAPAVEGNATVFYNKWFDADHLQDTTATVNGNGTAAGVVNKQIRRYKAVFGPVDAVLTGTVRIYNANEGRDMLLNAKAIANFTEDNRMLWAPGEYASIADRCIIADDNNTAQTNAAYNATCIDDDAEVFRVKSAVYTFANANGDSISKLLITQPYKRHLAQLASTYTPESYKGVANGNGIYNEDKEKYHKLATGSSNYFTVDVTKTWDEDEQSKDADIGGAIITSPASTSSNPDKFNKEVQEVNSEDIEKNPGFANFFDTKNGFTEFAINGSNSNVPAISTEMVGSKAGASAEMNWIYTDTNN